MRRVPRLLAILYYGALAAISPNASAESINRYQEFIIPGKTSQQEVRQLFGWAQETIHAEDVEVWVYSDKVEIPTVVSLIPVVGEIAGIFELVQAIRKNHELIIQFTPPGIVRKAKLRDID